MSKDSTMVTAERDDLLSVQEVAEIFAVHRTTVWRWIEEGRLPCFRLGGKIIRIPRQAVMDYLARCASPDA